MSKKASNKTFLGGLAVALLLPLSFWLYYTLKVGEVVKDRLPHYYIVDSIAGKDTVYHRVADITFTNQLGNKVSLNKTLAGKIVVIDFFFTRCPSICPRLTANIRLLQKAFMKKPFMENSLGNDIQFLSVTVNPEHDSFPVLRAYADRFGANHDHWWFLTGNKKDIYNLARNELRLSVQPGDGGADDFIHTEKLVLLDTSRYIRGYYNGLDTVDLKRCADDIVLLTLEKKRKKK